MACLDEAGALAFTAGEVPFELRHTIEEHVDDCDSCRQLLAALVRREAAPTWAPGHAIGRYVVRGRIGRGGMGTVYRADDVELGRPVALKRLHAGVIDERILMREARAAAQLQHPNVVTVHEVGDDAGAPFIVMELIEGTTLTSWLRDGRTWREVVAVLAQAGRGLAAAHARGLVHRDFKPDNVLVDAAGHAKVADFGLARVAPGPTRAHVGALTRAHVGALGSTLGLAGTPAYLAPELVDGGAPDARSDQFAFAITLYEALYGRHPFVGTTAEAIWAEMAAGRVRPATGRVPAWLDRHVRRALAADPRDRWPDVASLVRAIERPPRRTWPYVVGAPAIAAIAATIAWVALPTRGDDCDRGDALVDGVWSPAVRDAQAHQLAAAAPHRDAAIATAGQLIDGWADAWRLGHRAACRADPPQRAERLGCLDRDLAALRAQIAAFRAPDPALVDHVVGAVAALPRPDDCASRPPPAERAPQPLLDRIARLDAASRAGRAASAAPELAGTLADAEATHDPATLAHVHALAGSVERALGHGDAARAHFARAAREAGHAGDDAATLEAILREAEVAIDQGHPRDALGMCDAADALVARAGLDRGYRVDTARADAYVQLGQTPDAVAAYRRAIAALEPRAARDRTARLELAALYGALGSALAGLYEIDDAVATMRRGLAIEEVELGKDHPEVGRSLHDLADAELTQGHLDQAAADLTRARQIFVDAGGANGEVTGGCDLGLGEVERARGRCDRARPYFDRAAAEFTAAFSPSDSRLAHVEQAIAQCDRETDHDADAIVHYRRAIDILERGGTAGMILGDAHAELAMALYETDQFAEARTAAERALDDYERAGTAPEGRVNAWLVLSELEARDGKRGHAIALVRQLLDALGDDSRPDIVELRRTEQARLAEWTK
ncbi:MAG TPA: protein kinase [Kofleriaceae bacterium]|nr:protein kinase [Kofleriaceae bacterium]